MNPETKINIFPLVCTLQVIQHGYTLAPPLQPMYIGICAKKLKINVGFPCYNKRSLILGLPYTGNIPTQPFNFIFKTRKKPIPSYGKRERIQL
jgi:hypothetical protein